MTDKHEMSQGAKHPRETTCYVESSNTRQAVYEVLKDYINHTKSFPGNDYWSFRFENAFKSGCPCRVDPMTNLLSRQDTFDWCPIHGDKRDK